MAENTSTNVPPGAPPGAIRPIVAPGAPVPAPFVYADQVTDLALGSSVSRITFSLEVPSGPPGTVSPQIIVGIPTEALVSFLTQAIIAVSGASATVTARADAYKKTIEAFATTFGKVAADSVNKPPA